MPPLRMVRLLAELWGATWSQLPRAKSVVAPESVIPPLGMSTERVMLRRAGLPSTVRRCSAVGDVLVSVMSLNASIVSESPTTSIEPTRSSRLAPGKATL